MCVIYAAKTEWPSEAELERGSNRNDDGAGIAWLEPVKGTLMVHWQKGFKDHKEVLKFIEKKQIQLPALIHFRTTSVGGKCAELCHPFPILPKVPLWTAGYAEQVLFHNGHLGDWEDLALKAGIASDEPFPEGKWSDTRAIAWLIHLKGPGIIPFILKTSRFAHFFSNSTRLKAKDYNKAEDHMVLHGTWIHKEGFSQSIETDFSNRGGVVVYARNFASWADDEEDKAEEKAWKAGGKFASPTKVSEPADNEWTLDECRLLLAAIEQEQKNAETVAN